MRGWAIEVAIPWMWRRGKSGDVCEVVLLAVYWSDGPGMAVSFTRDESWSPLRVIVDS